MNAENLQLLRSLNFSGIAVTAAIKEDGTLEPVAGVFEKLLAAALERFRHYIHTVVVAKNQQGVPDELKRDEPHVPFRVIFAENVFDAIRQLAVDAQTRWKDIIDCSVELNRHRDFVGRQWLKEWVLAFVEGHKSGYLLLTGGPGVGKSAFVAEMVRESLQPTFHFIKRGMGNWDEPAAILRSLTAQLRRKYALPQTDTEQRMTESAAFLSMLQRVSRNLNDGQKEVIYLDGLDEAFGPTGRFAQVALPGILPRMLPDGIVMVLTSRPGEHLNWLQDPTICDTRAIDSDAQDNRDDIRAYLSWQNQMRNLGLDFDFIERLVEASEGIFAVAVLYLRERPDLHTELQAWRADPSRIPRGLTGWLIDQWQRILNPLPPKDPVLLARWSPPPPDVIRAILGLLATAREPLSRDHLMTFLDFVVRHEAHQGSIPTIGFLPMAELTRHLNEVLRLSQEFFDPIDLAQGAAAPYCFFHTRFPEFIAAQLSEVERKDCHCLLAQGCSGFKQFKRSIRYYALRHRLAHLIAGQDWEGVASIFAESDFIVERSERFGFASVHADALTTAQHPNLPHDWREAFSEWERFLRLRMWGLQLFPAAYPQEVFNEFLPTAPKPLDDALTPLRDSFPFAYNLSLRKTFGPTARIGSKHKDMMECVAFSPDGSFMASGSRDGTVKVWESATSKLAADCHGHTGGVESIAFSSDGRFVASGSADTTVKVWQAETGRLTADCRGHTDKVNSIAFSPDRRFVASGSSDWTMKIWESETGWLVADCVGHEYDVCSVVFSFDGRFVASGSYDGTVVVWEAETGLVVGDCIGHTRIVRSVAFSPDGRFVASGSSDMTVKVWEAKTGRLVATCVGHQDIVSSVVFSPDGRFVASGSHDGTVKVWKAETGRLVMDGVGHEHWVYSVAFSPEGGFVVSLSNDQTVKIWELKTGGCVNTLLFDHDVLKVAFLANQPRLMVADCAGQVFGYEVIAL